MQPKSAKKCSRRFRAQMPTNCRCNMISDIFQFERGRRRSAYAANAEGEQAGGEVRRAAFHVTKRQPAEVREFP